MKKLLVLSTVLALIVSSCSSDDNSKSADTAILPKTITYTYPPETQKAIEISAVKYDGNKINSITALNKRTSYTYTGDLITKLEIFERDRQGKEIKIRDASFTYEGKKLKTKIVKSTNIDSPGLEYNEKTVYTHLSDELINYITYSVNPNTNVETKTLEGSLIYENDNLVKFQANNANYVYEYDNKNNPLKNVLSLNLLLNEIRENGKNNVLKITSKPSPTSIPAIFEREYTYNDKDFPTKNISYTNGEWVEFDIEYTY